MKNGIIFVEFGDRHKFDGGNTKAFQVRNFFDNTQVGTRCSNPGADVFGKSTNMEFVYNGFR